MKQAHANTGKHPGKATVAGYATAKDEFERLATGGELGEHATPIHRQPPSSPPSEDADSECSASLVAAGAVDITADEVRPVL